MDEITVKVDMPRAAELVRRKGLHKDGHVQRFHTSNVNRRIGKYMPHLTGDLETKLKRVSSGTEIVVLGPYAKYQYHGIAMAGKAPKVVTDKALEYTKDFNPKAGPYWDRALVTAEGETITADLQRYINRKR